LKRQNFLTTLTAAASAAFLIPASVVAEPILTVTGTGRNFLKFQVTRENGKKAYLVHYFDNNLIPGKKYGKYFNAPATGSLKFNYVEIFYDRKSKGRFPVNVYLNRGDEFEITFRCNYV
jgi:hypothetical protein